MKIAQIGSRGFPGFAGGVEKGLAEICPRLVAKGHEVTLYCSAGVTTKEAVYRGVCLRRTPAVHSKHLETISRVFLSAMDALFRDYDIVHFHAMGPALLSWITRLKSCRTVVTLHGLDWQRAKWGLFAKKVLQIGERAAVFFPHKTAVDSKPLVPYFKDRYGKDVIYVPNGVTIQPALAPDMIRRKWSLEPKSYILFASRLVPEKGCHTLIQAFLKVKSDKKLVIAGSSWYSDDYVAELKRMADGRPDILFVGWADGDVLRELFSNAYLYCLPSEIEGLSLSLLEGMSYGVCPVVSDIPENQEAIGDHAGVLFKNKDASDLAGKLTWLLRDAQKAIEIGRAAQTRARKEYDWDEIVAGLERLYLDLIPAGKKC